MPVSYKIFFKIFLSLVVIANGLESDIQNQSFRLPKTVVPISYELFITPYFEPRFMFLGETKIKIKIIEDTKTIILHADELEIYEITLPNNTVNGRAYNALTKQIAIVFENILVANQHLDLTLKYFGIIRDDSNGFFRRSYYNENGDIRWIAATQFEPVYARRTFPCFDEPSFKAKFKINIALANNYISISNMGSDPKKEPHKFLGDREWHRYNESNSMSTYLVAFVIVPADFKKIQEPDSRVSVWTRSNKALKECPFASRLGSEALNLLEKLFHHNYTLDHMNFIPIPGFSHLSAMENWGLIIFNPSNLLCNAKASSTDSQLTAGLIIIHELIHQWFGNLVTLDWWDFMWLNEGFAEYLSYVVADKLQSKFEMLNMFVINSMNEALNFDAKESSHPMNSQIQNPTDSNVFDDIFYQKAASVIRMFHQSFGDDAFYAVLRAYIKNNAFKNTRPEHLIFEFEKYFDALNVTVSGQAKVKIATIMNSWTNQAGYPLVTVTRKQNIVTFRQQRFLIPPAVSSVRYWIPITFTTDVENNFHTTAPRLWLGDDTEKTHNIDSINSWLLVNIQQVGYYRVNYDEANWKALIDVLNSDNFAIINKLNRAQLINDAFSLAQVGLISFDIALNATKYLSRETSYYPWRVFFQVSQDFYQKIRKDPKLDVLYKKYVLFLISAISNKLRLIDDDIVELTKNLFLNEQILYEEQSVSGNTKNTAQCASVENQSNNLKCLTDPAVITMKLRQLFKESSNSEKDIVRDYFVNYAKTNELSLETALKFLENDINVVYEYFEDWDSIESIVIVLAKKIVTASQIKSVKKLSNDPGLLKIKSQLDATVIQATKYYEWLKQFSDPIWKWLKNVVK